MDGTKLEKNTSGLTLFSCFVLVSFLFNTCNHENIEENLTEKRNEPCWSTRHPIHGNIKFDYNRVDQTTFREKQRKLAFVIKFASQGILVSPSIKQVILSPSYFLDDKPSQIIVSELSLPENVSGTALDILSMSSHFKHQMKKRNPNPAGAPSSNPPIVGQAPPDASPASSGPSPPSAGPAPGATNATGTSLNSTTTIEPGNTTSATNDSTTTLQPESQGEGWPLWAWIIIAVAAILVIIAIIISIIVCINMNKTPEEMPPSAAESAESLGSSESEESEEEGERRLHRGRRQVAACSYCPQTLQRYGNDGPPCGRNCCNMDLHEQTNISNTS